MAAVSLGSTVFDPGPADVQAGFTYQWSVTRDGNPFSLPAGTDTTGATFCFTPEHRGIEPHHTSPPQAAQEFAEFCAEMVRRYAPADRAKTRAVAAE